ncbi:uncharacterized protein ATNIH1004_005036 [Aspergillus tanneri]|uniref:Uncharacterized protein n=1 Tax=Aspergillus tanneri TaxID=1220188 RepID=A0A5M9MPW1_9EURO|nr:uncharacterized protein ATNIH1004_005036 [Aspergillus tanneri]KAA8649141.1 hypothetical protein ATNIH1004_005036 [Aspergillus tanneri]
MHYNDRTVAELRQNRKGESFVFPELISTIPFENGRVPEFTEELHHVEDDWEYFHCLIPQNDPLDRYDCTVSSQELISLFNIALRKLISGQSHRKHESENESEETEFQPLSQIAPSVFNPGYREAMSQRSQFIPSLAKSMASIFNFNRDQRLQQMVNEPRFAHQHQLDDSFPDTSTVNIRRKFRVSLWIIARKQLYKPHNSQKFSPLWPEMNSRGKDEKFDDEVLVAESPTDQSMYLDDNCVTEHVDSDYYLGTDEGDYDLYSVHETSSLLTIDERFSDCSVGIIDHNDTDAELTECDEVPAEWLAMKCLYLMISDVQ